MVIEYATPSPMGADGHWKKNTSVVHEATSNIFSSEKTVGGLITISLPRELESLLCD